MKTKNTETPLARYIANRNPEAQEFVRKITQLLSEYSRMTKPTKKAAATEMEMLLADATFGADFGFCANLYEFDAVRGVYDGCLGSDALSNEEIEKKFSPFSK